MSLIRSKSDNSLPFLMIWPCHLRQAARSPVGQGLAIGYLSCIQAAFFKFSTTKARTLVISSDSRRFPAHLLISWLHVHWLPFFCFFMAAKELVYYKAAGTHLDLIFLLSLCSLDLPKFVANWLQIWLILTVFDSCGILSVAIK